MTQRMTDELTKRVDELEGKIGQWLESDGLTSAETLMIISEAGVLLALYKAALTACQHREAAAQEEIKRLRGVIGSMQQTTDALLKKLCWQPISSAPKDRRILLWHDKIYTVPHIGWWNFADEEFELIEIFKDKKEAYAPPTHWAELPGTLKAQALAQQQGDGKGGVMVSVPICIYGDAPAVARCYFPKGCTCFPFGKYQDRCEHHLMRADDSLHPYEIVYEYVERTKP